MPATGESILSGGKWTNLSSIIFSFPSFTWAFICVQVLWRYLVIFKNNLNVFPFSLAAEDRVDFLNFSFHQQLEVSVVCVKSETKKRKIIEKSNSIFSIGAILGAIDKHLYKIYQL